MEKDCEIFIDPEEDEVFFGCISEKEKHLCTELGNQEDSNFKNDYKNEVLGSHKLNVDEQNNKNNVMNEQSGMAHKKMIINDPLSPITANQHDNSVEMEHNYSTSIKPKIDKSILTTPKSIVKADKDGGFLKVLSEIALVKAEAENSKELGEREDEDKENQTERQIPEIRVTEATPERTILSPPSKNTVKQIRQFKIVYRSPGEDKFEQMSHSDTEKDTRNIDQVPDNKKNLVDLIDLDDEDGVIDTVLEGSTQNNDLECADTKLNDAKELDDEVKEITVCESPKHVKITVPDVKSPPKIETSVTKRPLGLRFSKEARKIVEVLKKSTIDDTLNFTIAEIDVENEENSFISPEPVHFEQTDLLVGEPEKPLPMQNKFLSKTVEKERRKVTPLLPTTMLQPVKHFSERKDYQQVGSRIGIKKCVKKLPLEEKRLVPVEKVKDVPSSKIPVFGVRNVKPPLSTHIPKATPGKAVSVKTPATKTIRKNPKFDHIESPINAYIHSKQTALVVNIKPEPKKNISLGTPKVQMTGSAKNPAHTKPKIGLTPVPEKSSKLQCPNSIRLPFVQYKSATPYKIEKVPESRLPRLAPSVQKLLGTHSPRVLKHEGRFYLTTPKKSNSAENSTIIADCNEVSVVVCQSAQKSNTIK